jgi:hypothetical protein
LGTNIPLGDVVEVHVLDANLFDDFTSLVQYCHLCVPLVNVNSKVHELSLRDAST